MTVTQLYSRTDPDLWAKREMPKEVFKGNFESSNPFKPVAEKVKGTAIGTIYQLGNTHAHWIGKVGNFSHFSHYLRDNSSSSQMNLDAILEKISADFYAFFRKKYRTPETFLSLQRFIDDYTKGNGYALHLAKNMENGSTIRFMSKYVDAYQDLAFAATDLNGERVLIEEFINKCHRPPEKIYSPNGELVPLKGLMELCAAIRILADTDGLGGGLNNVGIIWERTDKITAARAVKIDPGFAFRFDEERDIYNRVLLTLSEKGYSQSWLADLRDIQISNNNDALTIYWKALTEGQKREYLDTLNAMMKISKDDLFYGFYRDGAFNHNQIEHMPEKVAHRLVELMSSWIELQKKIYQEGLTLRKASFHYPPPLANFAGRKNILEELTERLTPEKDKVNLTVLSGLGGMGKSELASYFAFKERKSFSLIYWLQSDSESNLINSYLSLAKFINLSLQDTSSLTVIREQVHAALEKREGWLLIFDNVESPLQLPKKGGSILITSQNGNLWPEDDVVDLLPLSSQEAEEFIQKETKEKNKDSISKLVEILGGIPLSLSHAAATIKEQGITIENYLKQASFTEKNSLHSIWQLTFSKVKQENPIAFEWLVICSFFHHGNISIEWLKDWLITDMKLSAESASIKASEIITCLKGYHLIQFDRQLGRLTLHKLLQEALYPYQAEMHEKALTLLIRRGKQFKLGQPETWDEGRQWYVHAESLLAQKHITYTIKHGIVFVNMGGVARHLCMFDKAVECSQKALETHLKNCGDKPNLDLAIAYNNLAMTLREAGRKKEGLEAQSKSIGVLHQLYGDTPKPITAELYHNMGDTLTAVGSAKEGLAYHIKALEMNQKIYGKSSEISVDSLTIVGESYYLQGDINNAYVFYFKALKYSRKTYGERHPKTATLCDKIAKCFRRRNLFREALGSHVGSLKILQECYGEIHPDVALVYLNKGRTLICLEEFDEAINSFQKAIAIYQQLYGDGANAEILKPYKALAYVLKKTGQLEKTIEICTKFIEMDQRVYGNRKSHRTAIVYGLKGGALFESEDYENSLAAFNKSLEILQNIYGDRPRNDIEEVLTNIATVLTHLDRCEEALDLYLKKILPLRLKIFIDLPPEIAETYQTIGRLFNHLNDSKQAVNYYKQSLEIYKKLYSNQPNGQLASSYEYLAIALRDLGCFQEALEAFQNTLTIRLKIFGNQAKTIIVKTYGEIGIALLDLEKNEDALNSFKQALEMTKEIYPPGHTEVINAERNVATVLRKLGGHEEADNIYMRGFDRGLFPSFVKNEKIISQADGNLHS